MLFSRVLGAIVVVGALAVPSVAQAQSGSPPPVNVDVPLVAQDTPQWCWLAVAEMVMRTRSGFSPSQCEMLEERDGEAEGNCCDDLRQCARAGTSLREVAAVLEQAGGIHTRYTMAILPAALYGLLSGGLPVVAQISETSGMTHAVVIRGMRYDGLGRAVLTVNDPGRPAPTEILYDDLAVGWLDSLVVER
jgi:hypothetical protein